MDRPAITGARAVVTGGSSGIGRALTLALARAGAHVAPLARRRDKLDELTVMDVAGGRRIEPVVCDVTNAEQVERAINDAVERLGGLDILVNNAGIGIVKGRIGRVPLDTWENTIRTNVLGAYYCTHFALPALLQSSRPRIINVGSGRRGVPMAGGSAYAVSKAALWMFTQTLAQEYWKHGILVNEVVPGPTYTEMTGEPGETPVQTFESERMKSSEEVADYIISILEFGPDGPTGQSFSLLRRPL